MPYSTGNPIGSSDFRDLSDNAVNFDYFANGPLPAYPNRLGQQKLSITGMNEQFNEAQTGRGALFDADQLARNAQFAAALASIGLTWIGDYGAGLNFTTRQQYTVRNGLAYVLANDTTLPYTSTGNWTLESTKFKLVNSDQVLRSDLALSSGAGLIGYDAGVSYPANTVGAQLQAALASLQRVPLLSLMPAAQRAAMLDGTTTYDATADLQAAFARAKDERFLITHDVGTVLFREAIVPKGMPGIIGTGKGVLKTNSTSTSTGLGVLIVQGSFYGPTFEGLDGAIFEGFTIDCNGGAKRGFFGSSVTNCIFRNLKIKNLDLVSSNSALRLTYDCSDNLIEGNTCYLPQVTDANTQSCYGIHIVANDASFSGWGTGNLVPATNVCARNRIVNNVVFNGTHGISLTGSDEHIIRGNFLSNNAHRNIHLIHSSRNLVTANQCREAGSSAIIMGYGASDNHIVGNYCYSNQPGGESAIEAYVASRGNSIIGNRIRTGANYGIYLAIDATTNTVMDNRIDCQVTKKAGIAIESDWVAGASAPFLFSRPNYGAPPSPRIAWPNGATSGNIVKGNVLFNGSNTIAAIYVSQLGTVGSNVLQYIHDNLVEGSSFLYDYYFVEQTSGMLAQQSLCGNTSGYGGVDKSFATRGRAHFSNLYGNDTFNGDVFYAPPANTATPSAFYSDKISLAAYSTATSVTDLVGGKEGQRVTLRLAPSLTLVHNASVMSLKGGNVVATTPSQFIELLKTGGVWFEQSRNF